MNHRCGTVLIIVAGLSALLASLALAFVIRQRSSLHESALFEQDIQAHIMVVAACSYICETARIGYETDARLLLANPVAVPPLTRLDGPNHVEAFGWIDVRDGSVGPNTRGVLATDNGATERLFDTALVERWGSSGPKDRPAWPAPLSVARCPMHVLTRPPYAIQLNAVPNPIVIDEASPKFGRPYLKNPDPMPLENNRAAFMQADKNVRAQSANRSWFRVYREGPATFIITCGAGGTLGYRDWNEVVGAGPAEMALFGDPSLFAAMAAQETRLWYRVEWSPAIATPEAHNIKNAWNEGSEDHYVSYGMNTSNTSWNPRSQALCRNMGGTMRYVERLRKPPTWW